MAFGLTLAAQTSLAGALPWLSEHASSYRMVWPQGWSYFADAPSSDTLVAYTVDLTGGAMTLARQQQATLASGWGLRRVGYSQLAEIQAIRREIPQTGWVDCPEDDTACARALKTATAVQLVNQSRFPTLCGDIVLMNERPVAWAPDRDEHPVPRKATRMALLSLRCD